MWDDYHVFFIFNQSFLEGQKIPMIDTNAPLHLTDLTILVI